MSVWIVQCQVEYSTPTGWHGSRQVPTFTLNPDYVGYDIEKVRSLCREIVDPLQRAEKVHVSAELL